MNNDLEKIKNKGTIKVSNKSSRMQKVKKFDFESIKKDFNNILLSGKIKLKFKEVEDGLEVKIIFEEVTYDAILEFEIITSLYIFMLIAGIPIKVSLSTNNTLFLDDVEKVTGIIKDEIVECKTAEEIKELIKNSFDILYQKIKPKPLFVGVKKEYLEPPKDFKVIINKRKKS